MTGPGRPSDHLLRTLASVPVTCRVLDLECGMGRHTLPLAQLGFDWWACDTDEARVEACREYLRGCVEEDETRRRIVRARPGALGFPDEHFDWVVAYGAYDAATDAAELHELLSETFRVLRRGGWVFAAMHRQPSNEGLTPEVVAQLFVKAGFALAEEPAWEDDMARGIFCRVDAAVRS